MKDCSKKKQYANYEHARFDAREIRRKHDREVAVPFKCRMCGKFHVGEPLNRSEGLTRKKVRA